jgi:acetyl esterase/lipase
VRETGEVDDESGTARVLALPQAPEAIELRHLRAFVAVAEELNFGRAAVRLYLSQPALSRQIRALERLVGCGLLRRSTHRVELTLAGEALLARARGLLSDFDDAVSVTRSVGGELDGRMARQWAPFVDFTSVADRDVEAARAAFELVHATFEPPAEIATAAVNASGVPSLLLTPPGEPTGTVLFLHGGGYVAGSAFGYRHLAAALALATGSRVLVPEYRLAPENPFPAAIEDAHRAYAWLIDGGTPASRLAVAGDSSGAGLVMSLLIGLSGQGVALPAATLLLCPWVDLQALAVQAPGEDARLVFTQAHALKYTAAYLDGHRADDPLVNPLHTDLHGLPPMLVQAGSGDSVLAEAQQLVDHARSCGVDARLEVFPAATHDFHLFWSFLPEAARALDQLGVFLRAMVVTAPQSATSKTQRGSDS